jgi:hypothetical protein
VTAAPSKGKDIVKKLGIFAFVFFSLSPMAAPQNALLPTSGLIDLIRLFRTLTYRLTPLEKEALVGKSYTGFMSVGAIQRDDASHSVRISAKITITTPDPDIDVLYFGVLSFQTRDTEEAASLKLGSTIRVTGRLQRIYQKDPKIDVEWLEFVDATIGRDDAKLAEAWFRPGLAAAPPSRDANVIVVRYGTIATR